MPPWLQRLLGGGNSTGLRDAIEAVLSRDAEGGTPGYTWPSSLPGARREHPLVLPEMVVQSGSLPTLDEKESEVMLSPFMTDTVFPLVGGPPERFVSRERPDWPYSPETVAAVEGPPDDLTFVLYDLMNRDVPQGRRQILSHEAGHMFSARDIDPTLKRSVGTHWSPELARQWPNSRNPEEHLAEAFSQAIHYLSTAQEILDRGDGLEHLDYVFGPKIPGTSTVVSYLLQQPIYKDHILNKLVDDPQD